MGKLKTLDLFAGVGGIRLGFDNANFESVFANDNERQCKITYDLNFKSAKLDTRDIWDIKSKELPDFDVLLAGFPCQAFSIAGYRHGFKDPRGNLFFKIAEILEEKRPQAFLLENVKNLHKHDGGKTYKVIEETLKELGYYPKEAVLNSMDYGNVPQNRERIYIVGFRDQAKTEAFKFPDKIPLTVSFRDLLDRKVPDKYYYTNSHLDPVLKKEVTSRDTVYQWRRKYVRANKKGVCPTLTANMGMGGHNVPIILDSKGIRKLTPRECFRMQGFEDSFILPADLADMHLYKQAGNSVSTSVIYRIAVNMKKVLQTDVLQESKFRPAGKIRKILTGSRSSF